MKPWIHLTLSLALGFAPGFFWLWMIARSNRHRPAPASLVIRTFVLGVAVAIPVVMVGTIVRGANGPAIASRMPLAEAAFLAFVVAGLIEEFGTFGLCASVSSTRHASTSRYAG